MSSEMLAAYHPAAVESAWAAWWEAQGYFKCDTEAAIAAGPEGRFVMVIPPPNVTGSLHLGHALTAAVEDALSRWHRMSGRPTMWLPGTDHAGIATQAVVEKRLARERGVTRHDLGREAFLKEVWAWKESYGSRITGQLRSLGVSADWSRERFTMDAGLSRAVVEAFVRLHADGAIYRDTRLVNWCPRLKTAISDIEVEYLELEKRTRISVPGHDATKTYEFGVLTSFAYKVAGGGGAEIVVATTRPETMLGDVAVAVHPDDPRYTSLHGAALVHPFFPDRRITVITDAELVDPAFGTGAVKITPAHDPNDYKCGKRHGLPLITVFTEDGRIAEAGGPRFAGLMRFDARVAVLKALEEEGLLRGKADNKMRLGICSRSGDVVEPLIKPQWYVRCGPMARAAADAVREGKLRLEPASHEATWFQWLDNIQDWCVSRQLWWGHRVPAYFVTVLDGRPAADSSSSEHWVVGRDEDEARAIAAARFGVPPTSLSLSQDEDVLDTWFSSALFPFATFGWPNVEAPDFRAFYPNSLLETGHDILFFWVARMVMMGWALTGELPFKTVYLHAMVRDKYGKKMSKSSGNVIDPLEVIGGCALEALHTKVREGNLPPKEVESAIKEQKLDFPDGIPECGADALRFGLLAYTVQGRDINLDISRVVAYRAFCNKLWNATRFALAHLAPDRYSPPHMADAIDELARSDALATRDRWILSRLDAAVRSVEASMQSYAFSAATAAAYDFWLYELCDWYLELIKPLMAGDATAAAAAGGNVAEAQRLSRTTLAVCLDTGLRLLHPFMPFVTEELWQRLPGRGMASRADGSGRADPPSIMIAPFPTPLPAGVGARPDVEADFALMQSIVRAGRGLRQEADLPPTREATFAVVAGSAAARAALEVQTRDIATLLRASSLRILGSQVSARVWRGHAGQGVTTSMAVPSHTSRSISCPCMQAEVGDGSSVAVVSESLSVHLQLKGLVDPAVEIAKLNARVLKVEDELAKLRKRMSAAGYEDKVPADVRAANSEVLEAGLKQVEVLRGLRATYESWAQ